MLKNFFAILIILFTAPLWIPMIKNLVGAATGKNSGGNDNTANFIENELLYPIGKVVDDVISGFKSMISDATNSNKNDNPYGKWADHPLRDYLYNPKLGWANPDLSNLDKFSPLPPDFYNKK